MLQGAQSRLGGVCFAPGVTDRAEQRRRMHRDGRGLGSKLVLFQNIVTFWRFLRWILNI